MANVSSLIVLEISSLELSRLHLLLSTFVALLYYLFEISFCVLLYTFHNTLVLFTFILEFDTAYYFHSEAYEYKNL